MSQLLMPSTDAMITLENVNKWYGQFHVLKNINLKVKQGERIVLCGPSGSGKSTTIRCINHLEEHQQGRIVVDGIELNEDIRNIERVRQEVGMVFQHFNLFPHLTVLQNCTLAPIWVQKMPKKRLKLWQCTTLSEFALLNMRINILGKSLVGSNSAWPLHARCA